ncbi:MAG: hypothetical protein AB1649_34085, partial [Chloroflexota bacterium]
PWSDKLSQVRRSTAHRHMGEGFGGIIAPPEESGGRRCPKDLCGFALDAGERSEPHRLRKDRE